MQRNKPLILVSLLLAAFVINLDTTIVNVALPSLVRQLGVGVLPARPLGAALHPRHARHRREPGLPLRGRRR